MLKVLFVLYLLIRCLQGLFRAICYRRLTRILVTYRMIYEVQARMVGPFPWNMSGKKSWFEPKVGGGLVTAVSI